VPSEGLPQDNAPTTNQSHEEKNLFFLATQNILTTLMLKSSAIITYQLIDLEASSTIKISSTIKNKEQSPKVVV